MEKIFASDHASLSATVALPVALATIGLALTAGLTENPVVTDTAFFLGGIGNDLFLITANLGIFAWAWRKKIRGLIPLTLWLDFIVWLTVQGAKVATDSFPWAMRPNGLPGGFPSGHATHSFAMAFVLTMLFPRFAWLWYLGAISISWSRIEVGAHSGLQVAAGVILGVIIGFYSILSWRQRLAAQSVSEKAMTIKAATVKQAILPNENL